MTHSAPEPLYRYGYFDHDADVGIVGRGYEFNLRERELEDLVQTDRAPEETLSIKGDGVAG